MASRSFSRSLRVPVDVATLFAWHERPGAFERLAPPFQRVRVLERQGGIRDGATVRVRVTSDGIPTTWSIRHEGYEANRQFRDVLEQGPFARWEHTHTFDADGPDASVLTDALTFALPLGALGDLVAGGYTERTLARVFTYRHAVLAHDLARHARFAARGSLRIAITGASGWIGSALTAFLRTGGHEVITIGRGRDADVTWSPSRGELDAAALEGLDAVVHLAGATIATRWTDDAKRAIRDSRVLGTSLLARTLARLQRKPSVLLSGSAIGVYGGRSDEIVDESSALGDGFLADVGRAWEAATAPAQDAGIRTVHLRTGIVTGIGDGALGKQWPLFRFGLAGRVGSGRQWTSPIALDDEIGAIHHCLMDERIAGPVNLVAPTPVTNAEWTREAAAAIGRGTFLPAPVPLLELVFGREMVAETLTASTRVVPTVLQAHDFRWGWPTVREMVRFESGRADYDDGRV